VVLQARLRTGLAICSKKLWTMREYFRSAFPDATGVFAGNHPDVTRDPFAVSNREGSPRNTSVANAVTGATSVRHQQPRAGTMDGSLGDTVVGRLHLLVRRPI
jgi:hypothetical protein